MGAILIGYRGSGKTTLGRKLAERLWLKFVDTDELIIASSGRKSIKEIFDHDGETKFRDLETQAVKKVLGMTDYIIAMGGGAVIREENRKAIKESGLKCIYLRCEAQALLERIQADPQTAANRPNLTGLGGGLDEVKSLLAKREPLYREVMSSELEVTYLSPDDAVTYLTRLL